MRNIRKICFFAMLAFAAIFLRSAFASNDCQKPAQAEKKPLHSAIIVKRTFSPQLASIIRQYRHLVVSAKLWRKSGKATVKAPPINRSFSKAEVTPPPKTIARSFLPAANDADVVYQITVTMIDTEKSDGSKYVRQTIVVEGSDNSHYTDTITQTTDPDGSTTETQDVSYTAPDGTTTTENSDAESGPGGAGPGGGGGGTGEDCRAMECDPYDDCCVKCKANPECGGGV